MEPESLDHGFNPHLPLYLFKLIIAGSCVCRPRLKQCIVLKYSYLVIYTVNLISEANTCLIFQVKYHKLSEIAFPEVRVLIDISKCTEEERKNLNLRTDRQS